MEFVIYRTQGKGSEWSHGIGTEQCPNTLRSGIWEPCSFERRGTKSKIPKKIHFFLITLVQRSNGEISQHQRNIAARLTSSNLGPSRSKY
jgi:hypothetical protein